MFERKNKMNNGKMMKYYIDEYAMEDSSLEMIENKMESLNNGLKEIKNMKFDLENPIKNYLNYWLKGRVFRELNIFNYNENDKLWLFDKMGIYDNYQEKAIKNENKSETLNRLCSKQNPHADTIFSFWRPLERCLRLVDEKNKIEGLYRNNGKIIQTIDNFIMIRDNIDKWFKDEPKLNEALIDFASVACSKGNVIEYPYKGSVKINFQQRGSFNAFNDLFLISLYNCFEGIYNKLFGENANFNSVQEWVEKENLQCFFQNKIISKDNIIKIGVQDISTKDWENIDIDEMIIVLKEYTRIIELRNNN